MKEHILSLGGPGGLKCIHDFEAHVRCHTVFLVFDALVLKLREVGFDIEKPMSARLVTSVLASGSSTT